MAERSTQNALWEVLDGLRAESPLTGNEFAVALAALIYLRWADFQEAEQEAVAAFDDAPYEPVLPGRFHWRSYHDRDPQELQQLFASELPRALEGFGNARHSPIATRLHRIAPAVARIGTLPVRLLDHLVRWLAAQAFETPGDRLRLLDALDAILLGNLDKFRGQFVTPPVVSRLIAALASPSAGQRVYDPCFGSAGLLTAAVDYVQEHTAERVARTGQPLLHVAGVEINPDAFTVGLTRLALSGIADPQLEVGNSLERSPSSSPQSDGFDIVLANPPWGGKVDPAIATHYPIRTSESAALFIQHAVSHLRPGGRAVVVVQPSILFGSGALLRLRQMLLEQHTIEAVVSLPRRVFMPYTSIESSILVLRHGGPTRTIRMVEASWFEEVKDELDHGMSHALAVLLEAVQAPKPEKHAWDVDVQSLGTSDFDLTPRRRDQSGLQKTLASLPSEVKVLSLQKVCQVMGGRAIRSDQLQDSPPRSPFEGKFAELEAGLREREVALVQSEQSLAVLHDELRRRSDELAVRERMLTEHAQQYERRGASASAELESRRASLHKRLAELEAERDVLRKRGLALEQRARNLNDDIDGLKEGNPGVAEEQEALTAEHRRCEEEQRLVATKLDRVQAELASLRAEAAELQQDLDRHAQMTADRLSEERASLREEQEALRMQMQAETKRVQQREMELQRARDEHRQAVHSFRQRLSDLQPRSGRSEESGADDLVPFIRIRDVQKGVVSKATSWLNAVAATLIEQTWKLRPGDILLSKSGTIGKAGIVRNGAVGGVAGNGFFVLRAKDESVDPHYLLAYLQSAECMAWLDDRARGSGIRHLAMGVVKELPVPIPPLPVQRRVADQTRKFGVDALTFLAELLSEDRSEPVTAAINAWIDGNLLALDRREASASTSDGLSVLEQIANYTCPVNSCERCGKPYYLDFESSYLNSPQEYWKGIHTTCLACWLLGDPSHGITELGATTPLIDWAIVIRMAVSGLRNVSKVPSGVGLLNVLQSVGSKVSRSLSMIKGHLPNEEKARRVTKSLLAVVDSECTRLLRDVKLVFSVQSVSEVVGGTLEVVLEVANEASLPVRELVVTTNPELGRDGVPYLAERTSQRLRLAGKVPSSLPVTFTLTLKWSAINLAGDRMSGTRDVPIDAASAANSTTQAPIDLGASPYVCGDPVKIDRPDVFVGREELLEQIRRQIMQSGNVVLLEGNRRTGKSSILWHLEGKDGVPGWLGVYCSLQGTEGDNSGGVPTAEVFRGMAYEIVQSVRKLNGSAILPDGTVLDSDRRLGIARALRNGISDETPFADFREYLALVLETLAKQGLGLLLMLDEFDKLQEGIDKGVTSPQVPENIRFLVQTYPKFSAILTGSRRLKRLREEYWSVLFGLGTRFSVSALSPPAAERLMTFPVQGRIAYARDALLLAYTLTAGQPYLLQCLCNRIFDIAARTGIRAITVDQVQEAAKVLVEDNEHFASLWDYTHFERRRFLLALLHRESDGGSPLTLGVIEEKLAGFGIEVREEILLADLDHLRELELIDLHGEASRAYYTLTIPMMGDWIERHQDFDALKTKARAEIEDTDE